MGVPVEHPNRAQVRLDPHWSGVWSNGAAAFWSNIVQVRRLLRAGMRVRGVPSWVDMSGQEARERLAHRRPVWWRNVLAILACVLQYRTISVEQLAWCTDTPSLASPRGAGVIWDLFTLHLIDIGVPNSGVDGSPIPDRTRLLRPSNSKALAGLIAPHCTDAELLALTGGQPLRHTTPLDRHNVLTTELLLRAAEWVPVAAVAGELHARVGQLLYTSRGVAAPDLSVAQMTADGVLVRADGARIAVEMTATAGPNFTAKVARWARVLGECRWNDAPCAVVFVTAPRLTAAASVPSNVAARTRRALLAACRQFPGSLLDSTRERMGFVEWEQWFPRAGGGSPGFAGLTVQCVPRDAGGGWRSVPLLDVLPAAPSWCRGTAAQLALLGSQPRVLARAQPVLPVWRFTAQRSGLGQVVPLRSQPAATKQARFPSRLLPQSPGGGVLSER